MKKGWLYLFYLAGGLAFLTKGLIGIMFPSMQLVPYVAPIFLPIAVILGRLFGSLRIERPLAERRGTVSISITRSERLMSRLWGSWDSA
jgi:predicted small integral membrane protein